MKQTSTQSWITAIFLLAVLAAAPALEVDQDEIRVEPDAVEFINYTGAHTEVNTREEILSIGSSLGNVIRGVPADQSTRGGDARYRIIHAVDSSVTEGFDADILILGERAAVDHIDNLRRILSAYLQSAYGYTEADGNTLAVFVTVYNAVHRGDAAYFAERYKEVVTRELTAGRIGLALSYTDWPGKTQIVIPLSDPAFAGTLSTVDTSSLTEDAVIESIRTDESSPQDVRRDMTELKERESDEAQERADRAGEEARQARTEAEKLDEQAAAAEEEAAQAQAEAEEAAAAAEADPGNEEAQQAAEEAAARAEEKQEEAETLRQEQTAAEERAEEKEQEQQREQQMAEQKQQEAATERREIAADIQRELDEEAAGQQEAVSRANPVAGLRVVDTEELLSEILLISTADGSALKTSALNSVRNRTLLDTGEAYIAAAGQSGTVRLVLIDKNTLEVIQESEQTLAPETMLTASNNDYYAAVSQDGGTYLGRFDRNLNLQARSSVRISPFTAITVTEQGIVVQDESSALRILRATDLVDVNR